MNPFVGVSKFGISASSWGFWIVKFGFASIFITYLLFHIISLGIEKKDTALVFTEVGKEISNPLRTAQETSYEIMKVESFNGLSALLEYWKFYYSIYLIYIWISIFMWCIKWTPLSDGRPFTIFALALSLFFFLEVLYFVGVLRLPIETPFVAYADIGKALVHLVANTHLDYTNKITGGVIDTCKEKVCMI